jgi:hypothetical protein
MASSVAAFIGPFILADKIFYSGPIEKGAADGQGTYCKELFAALKAAVSNRPRSGTQPNGAAGAEAKGKKKGRKGKTHQPASPTSDGEETPKRASAKSDWGLLEPLHPFLGPVVGMLAPLLTGNVVYGLLVGLLVAAWFGFGFTNRQGVGQPGYGYMGLRPGDHPDRLAAYEEMWRREESELWAWLEERVGLDRLGDDQGHLHLGADSNKAAKKRNAAAQARTVEQRLREEGMDDREIREAIRVTEEKLDVLKGVVERKADARKGKGQGQEKEKPSQPQAGGRAEAEKDQADAKAEL